MNDIYIYSKSNYGNVSWYITDTETAKLVSQLTGKKTVSNSDVAALNALGFKVFSYVNGNHVEALDAMTGNVSIDKLKPSFNHPRVACV